MAQFGRPISDLDNTGVWTTAPLWSKINGVVGSDDTDFVVADGSPTSTEPFTVDCGTITDPSSSSGHILRLRAAKDSGGANYDIVCELRQGYTSEASQGTLIATASIIAKADTTPETVAYTLSGAEADTITNYADLQFRCYGNKNGGGANRNVTIYDVELETPDAPATLDLGTVALTPDSTVNTPILGLERPLGTVALTPDSTVNTPILGVDISLGTVALTPNSTVNTPVLNVSGTVDLGTIALTPDSTVNTPILGVDISLGSVALTPDSTVNTPILGLNIPLGTVALTTDSTVNTPNIELTLDLGSVALTPDSTVNTPNIELTLDLGTIALTPDSTVNTPNLNVGGTLDLGTVALTPDSTVNTPILGLDISLGTVALTPDSTVNTPVLGLDISLGTVALTTDSTVNTPNIELTLDLGSPALTPNSTVNTPNIELTIDLGTIALTTDSTLSNPTLTTGVTNLGTVTLTPNSTVNTPNLEMTLDLSASVNTDSTVNTPSLEMTLGLSASVTTDSTVNTPVVGLTRPLSASIATNSTVNNAVLSIPTPPVEGDGMVNVIATTIKNTISISALSGGVGSLWTILNSQGALTDFNFKKTSTITLNGSDIADITSDAIEGIVLAQSNPLNQPAHIGSNTVQFDGVDEFLSAETGLANIINNNEGEIFLVVNTGTTGVRRVFFSIGDKDNDNNKIVFEKSSADVYRIIVTISGVANPIDFGSAPSSTWVVLSFSSNGSAYKCFQNKVESPYSSGTNDGAWFADVTGLDSIAMGKISQLTPVYFDFSARGVAYFNAQKDNSRNNIVSHLGQRHGVSV